MKEIEIALRLQVPDDVDVSAQPLPDSVADITPMVAASIRECLAAEYGSQLSQEELDQAVASILQDATGGKPVTVSVVAEPDVSADGSG